MTILSICIPTFNRSSYLKKTIESIISQERFIITNDVEVIISDNCSNDDTEEISLSFVKENNGKISYYRNEKNILDLNFEMALSKGRGEFLKLNNDTLMHVSGSLNLMIETIIEAKKKNSIIIFSNGMCGERDVINCKTFDSLISEVSFTSTWIGSFGIWRNIFIELNQFSRCSLMQLVQVDSLYRQFIICNHGVINNQILFVDLSTGSKGGYDFLNVFLDNYLEILTIYLNNNFLSHSTLFTEKRKLLINYIAPWVSRTKVGNNSHFVINDMHRKIWRHYENDKLIIFYFYITVIIRCFVMYIKKKTNLY